MTPHYFTASDEPTRCDVCGFSEVAGRHIMGARIEKDRESLRDKFAIAALTGIASVACVYRTEPRFLPNAVARLAYQLADAMLAERQL